MKSSFRFPLETVLRVRRLREEQARLELAQAQGQLARSYQALKETEILIRRVSAAFKERASRLWTAPDYQMVFRYLEHLKVSLQGWQERIAQEEAWVREKLKLLEQRHQECRLLERLREKKYAEFRRDLASYLESQTEAMVLARWSRF
jgi:flagellar FliJ protein|uniref:Flagellar FliJ protein n=1 Tax=Desulfobacca acetoxidans TaxID=60893 RepID=A0A7C5AKG9_9BACT